MVRIIIEPAFGDWSPKHLQQGSSDLPLFVGLLCSSQRCTFLFNYDLAPSAAPDATAFAES